MVQIPIFDSKNTPQRIGGVTSGVPNLVGAAMMPYQSTQALGNTIQQTGVSLYKQQLDFETSQYDLAKNFEVESYGLQKDLELKEYELKGKYKLEQLKQKEKLKTQFEIKKIELQRETDVKNGINNSLSELNGIKTAQMNNSDTKNALNNFDKSIKDLKDKISKGFDDEYTRQIFQMEFDDMVAKNRVDVESAVNKNVLANNFLAFEDEVNILKNQIIYGNANLATDAWVKLLSENSIVDKKYTDGMLKMTVDGRSVPVTPDVYKEKLKKEIFNVQADIMSGESPNIWKQRMEDGYWEDKLTPEEIKNYNDQAERVLSTNQTNAVSQLKSQATTFNKIAGDFVDPTNPQYFGSLSQYEELLSTGTVLMENLYASGEDAKALEVANTLKNLNFAFNNHNIIKDLQHKPLEEVRTYLNTLRGQLQDVSLTDEADSPTNQNLRDLIPHVEKLYSSMESMINNDLIGFAETHTGMSVPTIDFQNTNFEQFASQANGYNEFVLSLQNKYNRAEPQFFRPDDLKNFKNIFENGNREEIETLVRNISFVAKDWSNSAFTQLSKADAPEMAHLGMLLNANGGRSTTATDAILDGFIALRNPDTAKLVGKVDVLADEIDNNFRSISEELLGDLMNNAPSTFNNITQSAHVIFADLISKNANLRAAIDQDDITNEALEKAWKNSIQLSAGLVMKSTGAFGGIEIYNGHPIIIPQEKQNATIEDQSPFSLEFLLENFMTDELLHLATAESQYSPTHMQEIDVKNLPYDFANKKDITVDQLFKEDGFENIFLETADYGEYYITFKNPGDPSHEYYQNEKRENIILNINRILPQLLKAAQEAPPHISIEFEKKTQSSEMIKSGNYKIDVKDNPNIKTK